MSPTYSIIIPAYNEGRELPATLQAIRAAMAKVSASGECIVVDNHSSDDTAEVARAHGADLVVYEPINQIARARNAGAAESRGRYLIFIDADTRIQPELLAEALRQLDHGGCVGGGSVVRFEGAVGLIGRFGIGLWERISKLTRVAAGSFLFCLREAFDDVGGYDEALYANRSLLKLSTSNDAGSRTLKLPWRTSVCELFDRHQEWKDVTEFTVDLPRRHTSIFFLGTAEQWHGA